MIVFYNAENNPIGCSHNPKADEAIMFLLVLTVGNLILSLGYFMDVSFLSKLFSLTLVLVNIVGLVVYRRLWGKSKVKFNDLVIFSKLITTFTFKKELSINQDLVTNNELLVICNDLNSELENNEKNNLDSIVNKAFSKSESPRKQ